MDVSKHLAKSNHQAVYKDLLKLIEKHSPNMGPQEVLAIAANLVGKLAAMQDQRVLSPAEVMQIIIVNIQQGNQEAMAQVLRPQGNA